MSKSMPPPPRPPPRPSPKIPPKAPVAVMVPKSTSPPPQPQRTTSDVSKLEVFGHKMFMVSTMAEGFTSEELEAFEHNMFLASKEAEELNEEGMGTQGVKIDILAEDLEKRSDLGKRVMAGTCTIKLRRWRVEPGYSMETRIEELQGLTDDDLLNQQVCIAAVRMLWHSGPLELGCKDHLILNKGAFEKSDVWDLLRCMGFKPCACAEFSLYGLDYDDVWCLGNREGPFDTE